MSLNQSQEEVYQSNEEIVERIRAGEVALISVLMKRHNQKLYRVARGMGIPNVECDDLLQQSYIQAYLKLPQFRGDSTVTTWLTRILINQCLMFLRKQRPSVTEDGSLEGLSDAAPKAETIRPTFTPESELLKRELRSVLEDAIEQLPEDYRVVYVMREIEEMSVRDIASALDISESNVKVRMHRARKQLQEELRNYIEPFELYEFGNARCDNIVVQVLEAIQETL
jgi:RNA polymerase sigma factor (sigma-70 family)